MLFYSFALRFFFNNRKRTYQAVLTLTLALIIYISTTLLVQGYSSTIVGMSDIIESSPLLIVTERGHSLSDSNLSFSEVSFLEDYVSSSPFLDLVLPQLYLEIFAFSSNSSSPLTTHLRLLDMELFELYQYRQYSYPLLPLSSSDLIVGQQLASQLSVSFGSPVFFSSLDSSLNSSLSVANIIQSGHEYDIELLADIRTFSFPDSFSFDFYSFAYLKVNDLSFVPTIISEIESLFPHLSVREQNQTKNFITFATDDVLRSLTLLQFLFFILMLLSITYTIFTLVKESERTIFVLRSIGSTSFQIILLFLIQSFLIGLFSAFLALSIGYFGILAIVSFVSASVQLPFLPLILDLPLFSVVFFSSIILSLLSGIYPAFVASKIRVFQEDH